MIASISNVESLKGEAKRCNPTLILKSSENKHTTIM